MKPHELRVVNEKQELDIKIEGLKGFLIKVESGIIPKNSVSGLRLLRKQFNVMNTYSSILEERIKLFS